MRTASVPLKSVALPPEHGGWGFTLEPLLLSLLLSPGLHTLGLFLLGLFGFLARHPLKLLYQDLRRGKRYARTTLALRVAGVYLALALAGFLLSHFTAREPFLLPLLLVLPLGAYMLWADLQGRARELFPEIAAALFMASLAPAGVLAGGLGGEVALGSFLALAFRDVAALYYARTQVLRARGMDLKVYPAYVALWLSVLLAWLAGREGLLPWATALSLLLLAIYGSLALSKPPVPAKVIGWTQMGFGLLVVLTTALGYTLNGLSTPLLGVPTMHRYVGWALVALAFLVGFYLLALRKVPRLGILLVGLYDFNALLGLLSSALSGQLLPHPLLALLGVTLLHVLLRQPYPWPGVGFLLLGFLLLWH